MPGLSTETSFPSPVLPRPSDDGNRPMRLLSVHNDFSQTNIPLEAFAHLAATCSGRVDIECCVLALRADGVEARDKYAQMYDPTLVDVVGAGWHWYLPWRRKALVRWLQAWRPDIVHVHHAWSAAMLASVAKRHTSARVVTTLHRDYRTLTRTQQFLLKVAMQHSDTVLCNSQSTLRAVQSACQLKSHATMQVVYNGVDTQHVYAATRDRLSHGSADTGRPLRIGSVGRLLPIKGFDDLLRATAMLRLRGHDIHTTLIGDGPERAALRSLASQLGLRDCVTFTGALPRQEVYRRLAELDVFVASSHSEGFCNAMVEAMAAGCAVVATDIDVFHELLGNDYVLYYRAGSPQQLADRLEHCLQAPAWSAHVGQSLRARATAQFSLEACTRNHLALYARLLQPPFYSAQQPRRVA